MEDIVVGLLAVAIAFVLGTGRDQPVQQRRRAKKDAKLKAKQEAGKPTESLPLRMLVGGVPPLTGRHVGQRWHIHPVVVDQSQSSRTAGASLAPVAGSVSVARRAARASTSALRTASSSCGAAVL